MPQDDIVHEDLTVAENIAYAARMRLPSNTPQRQREQAVQDVLNMLGLAAVQNSLVGSVASRGISGGQRKRCGGPRARALLPARSLPLQLLHQEAPVGPLGA